MYAAIKVEETIRVQETIFDADVLYQTIGKDDSVAAVIPAHTVLNTELTFFQSLNFQLVCFHPYRSLDALVKQAKNHTQTHKHISLLSTTPLLSIFYVYWLTDYLPDH